MSSSRAERVIVQLIKKNPTLKIKFKTQTLPLQPFLFLSVIKCKTVILTDDFKEVVKPCQSYHNPILQTIMP